MQHTHANRVLAEREKLLGYFLEIIRRLGKYFKISIESYRALKDIFLFFLESLKILSFHSPIYNLISKLALGVFYSKKPRENYFKIP